MKKLIIALAITGSLLFAPDAKAEEHADTMLVVPSSLLTADMITRKQLLDNVKLIYVDKNSDETPDTASSIKLIENFYIDQYRQFNDPEAPYFMFLTKSSSLAMGVGGKVLMHTWYDLHGAQDNYEFYPYNIQIPLNPSKRRGLGASVNGTLLFVTVLGRRNGLDYQLYAALKAGTSYIKLDKAYVKLNDFTIGYASSTFSDGAAVVPTVDAQGPNGAISKTQVLGRYEHTFPSGFTVGGGVEFPSTKQNDVAGETEKCSDYMPDIVGLVKYSWKNNSYIRLAGLIRNMAYRDLLAGDNHNVAGWGVQLSGNINIVRPLTGYFTAMVGEGVGSYVADLSAGSYDLVGESKTPGKMIAPLTFAYTAGLKYDFTQKFFACVGFGQVRTHHKNPMDMTDYMYGMYGNINFFWRVSTRLLAGIEYVGGKRVNFNGEHGRANRIDAMMSFSF